MFGFTTVYKTVPIYILTKCGYFPDLWSVETFILWNMQC